jgi:hypothetical protein
LTVAAADRQANQPGGNDNTDGVVTLTERTFIAALRAPMA